MEAEEIKKAKEKLAQDITALINNFNNETGAYCADITVTHQKFPNGGGLLLGVNLTIEI